MKYKLSVIMPIYNAETFLKRTIDSVINQTIGFENIEFLLVDDNSTDRSREIIQEYASKYSNIIPIFLKENSGWASIPRNEGIKQSTSDYIMFIDSDDEYEPSICEKFYKCISEENADLVSCNYISIDSVSSQKIKFNFEFENPIEIDDKIIITNENVIEFDNVFVWNKIFKKSILMDNNIFFKEVMSEDFIFCIGYLVKSSKRIYLHEFYGYKKYPLGESLSKTEVDLTSTYNHIKSNKLVLNILTEDIKEVEKLKKIHNQIFKIPIVWIIEENITMKNTNDIKKTLTALYLFEKSINFESKLDNKLFNIINQLLLRKKCSLIIIIFRISNFFFNIKIIRRVYRKILN